MSELLEQAGTGRLGGYEILLRLKSGGMGEVLLARRLGAGGFEKLVALKTIRAELRGAEELRTMFLDEAKLLARLSHPAIAQVYDFGEQGDELFLAMEYVEGVRFRALADRRPPPAVAARAMADVCRGLHAAHELTDLAGNPMVVVHRDVTPENLMLTFSGRVKILDFGIALMRGRQAPATELGTIKGKPPYLSPEQLKNEPVDRRTDIFSASIVLHELLTGEPLFVGDSVYAVARAIEHEDAPAPSTIAGPLPPGLDRATLRGLCRDPSDRYPTALAMAEELERIAAAAGGDSLETYAAREFAAEREQHRRELQALLARAGSAMSGPTWRSRPSGVITAQAGEADLQTPPAREVPDLSTGDLDAALTAGKGRGRRWLGAAALLVALVGLGGALLLGWPECGSSASSTEAAGTSAEGAVVGSADGGPAGEVAADAAPPSEEAVATADEVADAAVAKRSGKPGRGARRGREAARPGVPDEPPPTGEEPPHEAAPAQGFGLVTIAAEPFALVRIDGVEVGSTPIFRRKIAAGEHEIVLASPDSGEVRSRRTIELAAGEHEKIILR